MEPGEQQEQGVTSSRQKGQATMRRRPEQRQAAKFDQRIRQVARKLFAERGVEGVSMHQIAQQAGVGQGTLYRRYAHKGDLILDLLSESVQRFLQDTQADAQDLDTGSALQRLNRVLRRCVTFIEEQGSFLAAIRDTSSDERRETRFGSLYYRTLHSTIASLLEEAITQDELSPLDTTYTADALLAALDSPLYLFQRHQRGYTPEQILQGLRRIYIEGVSFRSPRKEARDDQPELPPFERGGKSGRDSSRPGV
jgi:AcrR family transcriptional regulator